MSLGRNRNNTHENDRQGGQNKKKDRQEREHRKVTGKIYKSKTPEDQKARIKIIKKMKNQRQRYLTVLGHENTQDV
jgi:hypothetical protein